MKKRQKPAPIETDVIIVKQKISDYQKELEKKKKMEADIESLSFTIEVQKDVIEELRTIITKQKKENKEIRKKYEDLWELYRMLEKRGGIQ